MVSRFLASKSSNLNLSSLFVCTNRKLNVIALLASQSGCIDNTSLVAGGSANISRECIDNTSPLVKWRNDITCGFATRDESFQPFHLWWCIINTPLLSWHSLLPLGMYYQYTPPDSPVIRCSQLSVESLHDYKKWRIWYLVSKSTYFFAFFCYRL